MFKRSSANYSLWPEQARPRRGMPLSLAAGGFAVGVVCAIAAVNVASQFIRPVAMEVEPVASTEAMRAIPVYSASSALVAGKGSASEGESPAHKRTVAKVALPTIGRAVPVESETDGRGGDSAVKMPPVRLTDNTGVPTATAVGNPKLIRTDTTALPEEKPSSPDQTKVASREPAPQASVEPPKPKAAPRYETRPAARARTRAQWKAERNRQRASRSRRNYANDEPRHNGWRPTYAARYRAGPVYGSNGAPVSGYFPN
jgi:hypothetical protein